MLVGAEVRCASDKAIVDVGEDRAGIDRRESRARIRYCGGTGVGELPGTSMVGMQVSGNPDAIRLLACAGGEALEARVGRAVEEEGPGNSPQSKPS